MGILRDTIDTDGLAAPAAPGASVGAGSAPTLSAPPAPARPSPAPPIPAPPIPASAVPASAVPASPAAGAGAVARSDLERRRDALAEQVTELHWDLGGLAYEMAIRDHFRLDVLVRRAALLQERDAELAEVERLLRMEQDGVAGSCPTCAAPHSRGALYCWQCGTTLMERLPSSAAISEQ
jgi:hypothetical protein